MKAQCNRNREHNLGFIRTSHGVEIDLVREMAGRQIPFEIKSAMTPNPDFASNLKKFADAGGAARQTVVYAGEPYPSFAGIRYINYRQFDEEFA